MPSTAAGSEASGVPPGVSELGEAGVGDGGAGGADATGDGAGEDAGEDAAPALAVGAGSEEPDSSGEPQPALGPRQATNDSAETKRVHRTDERDDMNMTPWGVALPRDVDGRAEQGQIDCSRSKIATPGSSTLCPTGGRRKGS
jgi:hypothetical protein